VRAHIIAVLYVDSDPVRSGELVGHLKESDDIEVRWPSRPSEALGMARNEDFDAIVSEYDMGEMNGIQLLEELRKFNEWTGFLLFTS